MKVFDSDSKQKNILDKNNLVKIYVCGPTVYDYCHLGHARIMVVFDTLVKHLRFNGYQVKYVRNITDIDDKIINKSLIEQVSIQDLTSYFIDAMHQDEKSLKVSQPDLEPRATENLTQMAEIITSLIHKGCAYQIDKGDVYFKVNTFKNYGDLSKKKLDELATGARVTENKAKKSPLDFVLWKVEIDPSMPSWQVGDLKSGRPGWHIECSAMAMKYLGSNLDIHGGGADLLFPHHENEKAQSEAFSGEQFVKNWMHVGFVQINQQKMSKSLNNFSTIKDLLKDNTPEILRLFLLSSHYRSPIDFSDANIQKAKNDLQKLYNVFLSFENYETLAILQPKLTPKLEYFYTAFNEALDDDLNTPVALKTLFELTKYINKEKDINGLYLLLQLAKNLEILQTPPLEFFSTKISAEDLSDDQIQDLINQRQVAKLGLDYQTADEIRDKLLKSGIKLFDKTDGTNYTRGN